MGFGGMAQAQMEDKSCFSLSFYPPLHYQSLLPLKSCHTWMSTAQLTCV